MEPQEPSTDIQNTEIIQTDFEKTAGTNKLKYVVVPVFCIIFLAPWLVLEYSFSAGFRYTNTRKRKLYEFRA